MGDGWGGWIFKIDARNRYRGEMGTRVIRVLVVGGKGEVGEDFDILGR